MTKPARPSPRPIFLEPGRRLAVKFYTSNLPKYLQAKLVFEGHGLPLLQFRSRTEPYAESYDLGTEALLINAVEQILREIGRSSLFFVEDTSLRIEALSGDRGDYPGLAVKEWFATTRFEDLDARLPREPKGRGAIVKSDIALHVPGLADPVLFHGETTGTIAPTAPGFVENERYPWLTPGSFNGWFIPEGAVRTLGEMSLEESWSHDFRVRSLTSLLQRLEEYAAALNFPPDCYSVQAAPGIDHNQEWLFPQRGRRTLVVVGPTCAGKTTLGQIARDLPTFTVVEASDVVRSFRRRGDRSTSALEFARSLLASRGPDVVAKKMIQLYRLQTAGDVVITGFRTIEELEAIQRVRPEVEVVLVEAQPASRYARYLLRGRDLPLSFRDFSGTDAAQWGFGLLRVAEDFADWRILNEGSLDDYALQVGSVLHGTKEPVPLGVAHGLAPRHNLSVHRLYRCLEILADDNRPMTCEEIDAVTAAKARERADKPEALEGIRYPGKRISANNVNKVLKQAPELAQRLESGFDVLRYRITDIGRAYVRLMRVYAGRTERMGE